MNILLTGRDGQLGRALAPLLQEIGTVHATGRAQLELNDTGALRAVLAAVRPDLIINAAAATDVDSAEADPVATFAVNAEAPRVMAEWAASAGVALVHFSTDYVFNGSGNRPWSESDEPAPLNVYGKSKLSGDEAVLQSGAAALILRTSWLYAAEGRNFLTTILRLAADRDTLRVVDDQIGAPTPAKALAAIVVAILRRADRKFAEYLLAHGGLVNATSAGETSWFGFAGAILEAAKRRQHGLRARTVRAIPTSGYPLPAARPLNSRLDLTRLRSEFGIAPSDWRAGLELVMGELDAAR